MRLIIVEKPMTARRLAKAARTAWPDEQLIILSAITMTMFSFTLPRGLTYSSYPLLAEPQFKANGSRWPEPHYQFCGANHVEDSETGLGPTMRLSVEETSNLINRAEHIVCAPDWDYSGVFGVEQLLSAFRPDLLSTDLPVIRLNNGLDEGAIAGYLSNLESTALPEYQVLKNAGRIKFYFDYNFTLNTLSILGNLYRDVFKADHPVFISKYALQLLLYVEAHGEPLINKILVDITGNRWIGTGKYPVDSFKFLDGLGSPASRWDIATQLSSLGLCSFTGPKVALTEKGHEFVARLHPDTKDFDLPFRLDLWMALPFEEAKLKVDSYLKTFFGKQKRLQKV